MHTCLMPGGGGAIKCVMKCADLKPEIKTIQTKWRRNFWAIAFWSLWGEEEDGNGMLAHILVILLCEQRAEVCGTIILAIFYVCIWLFIDRKFNDRTWRLMVGAGVSASMCSRFATQQAPWCSEPPEITAEKDLNFERKTALWHSSIALEPIMCLLEMQIIVKMLHLCGFQFETNSQLFWNFLWFDG